MRILFCANRRFILGFGLLMGFASLQYWRANRLNVVIWLFDANFEEYGIFD
jgi:hypothetical protein